MRRRFPPAALSVLLGVLLSCTSGRACAQDAGGGLQAAGAALQRGDYAEARTRFKPFLDEPGGDDRTAAVGYFETYLATGAYQDGLREVGTYLQRAPDDPFLLHMQGRLLMAVGQRQEAEAAFRGARQQQPDFWRNTLALADLLRQTGRWREAIDLYAQIYRGYQQGTFRTDEALRVAGRAAAVLERFHDANAAFRTAYQLAPQQVETLYWWAELFREKYNDADAQRTYEEALGINANWADLYVGYARSMGSFARQEELAQQALTHNPNSVGALALLAELRVLDGLYDEAAVLANRALEVNPASIPALAQLASAHYLAGDTTAFATVEAQAREVNPEAADFYIALVENCTRRFRYPDAVTFGYAAVEADRRSARAQAALGTGLLRLGRVREARRYLEASYETDPFNLFVSNTLTLLDEYEDFDLLESEHFRLLIHQSESAVLGPAMLEVAEACYDSLGARYPYTPPGKILMEAYNDGDDFAVRVAGVPHLGLLGVSFGDVVALQTPRAQTGSPYNWARTLWHELAHTMAIGVSDFHVPRWFTEGLSVYEEQRARPDWGREMDLELFTAFDEGKLLPLAEIDKGFTRPTFPGQVLLSYYHASKVIAFIVDTYGFEAIPGLLEALRAGNDTAAGVRQVLGQDLASLDAAFRERLRQERQAFAPVLTGLAGLLETEGEQPAAPDDVSGNPYFQRLREGSAALEAARYDEAEAALREALDLFPGFIGPGNPYQGLAAVYEAQGKPDQQAEILTRFLEVSEYGAEEARTLSAYHQERGDLNRAAAYLARSLEVEPYDLAARTALADLYDTQGRHALAARERRAILSLDPVDRAQAYYQLAQSLYQDGRTGEAKRAVLQSLEIAPGYREAQKLLLACVDEAE